jgi:hypothetical protein
MTLLVKQRWRLLHNHDIMVATLLKEKYYPKRGFFIYAVATRKVVEFCKDFGDRFDE